jgi:hypothetical protein
MNPIAKQKEATCENAALDSNCIDFGFAPTSVASYSFWIVIMTGGVPPADP